VRVEQLNLETARTENERAERVKQEEQQAARGFHQERPVQQGSSDGHMPSNQQNNVSRAPELDPGWVYATEYCNHYDQDCFKI
jgi:hypothetical protein